MKYRFSICLVFSKRKPAVDLIYISAWFYNMCTAAADPTVKHRLRVHTEGKGEVERVGKEEKYWKEGG